MSPWRFREHPKKESHLIFFLLKMAVRKSHICQCYVLDTNSSHGVKFTKCEICGSTKRIARASPVINCQ